MRILIIEDDREIAGFLKQSLEAEYYAVDTAFDGEEGLSLALFNEYDLVILDISLPVKSGTEVCRELRSVGEDVPIIILSVKSDTLSRVELLNLGADDFVPKPFSFEELQARIRTILRRPKNIKSELAELHGYRIDLTNKLVRKNGKEIYLSRKSFMVLECLLRNRGKLVSRAKLFENVWDINTDPLSNTIDSHILGLRKKLDPAGKLKIIRTIPGRGFIID